MIQTVQQPVEKEYFSHILNIETHTENRKYALALAFPIDEIRNPDLLPNMSLLFEFSEYNCYWESKFNNVIHLSLQNHDFLPNFICEEFTKCAMALTSLNWTTTVTFNTILNNFMSQQMDSEDTSLALAMVSFIIHFNWNWVGLAISDNDKV
ncbi:Vomeronasal 2, receptor 117 [Apodemus speciosus]|uniref:Vomeronasal 2, receptor 117 n=1 Tax=Apodemus speciosus TaxID=105296 RepID=A0ABQ0FMZ2_APOSI